MSVKRRPSEVNNDGAPRDPRGMVKATLPKIQSRTGFHRPVATLANSDAILCRTYLGWVTSIIGTAANPQVGDQAIYLGVGMSG